MALLSVSLSIVGCAGSTAHARVRYVTPVGKSALPYGAHLLVREMWRQGGGAFLIVAENGRNNAKDEPEISTYEEVPGARGIFPSSGGLLGGSSEGAVLVLDVKKSCRSSYEQALAYGLLRHRRDTVTAVGSRGAKMVLRKVEIPAKFKTGDVLVYGQVGQAPIHIVTSAPDGRVVSNEPYPYRCR